MRALEAEAARSVDRRADSKRGTQCLALRVSGPLHVELSHVVGLLRNVRVTKFAAGGDKSATVADFRGATLRNSEHDR